MFESKVEGDFVQDVFRPTMIEFVNFSEYVKSLEEKDLSFALVSFYCLAFRYFIVSTSSSHFCMIKNDNVHNAFY